MEDDCILATHARTPHTLEEQRQLQDEEYKQFGAATVVSTKVQRLRNLHHPPEASPQRVEGNVGPPLPPLRVPTTLLPGGVAPWVGISALRNRISTYTRETCA